MKVGFSIVSDLLAGFSAIHYVSLPFRTFPLSFSLIFAYSATSSSVSLFTHSFSSVLNFFSRIIFVKLSFQPWLAMPHSWTYFPFLTSSSLTYCIVPKLHYWPWGQILSVTIKYVLFAAVVTLRNLFCGQFFIQTPEDKQLVRLFGVREFRSNARW